jgi:hypothetical protein
VDAPYVDQPPGFPHDFGSRTTTMRRNLQNCLGSPTSHFEMYRWQPKQYIETEHRLPSRSLFSHRRFYRGGFETNGLQILWWRVPISTSCNVTLGDPNEQATLLVNTLRDRDRIRLDSE